jgi:glycosyltransferase involved in cell wall biosynthesis
MPAKKPKISVIMPAHNAENYISEAIESILNQTFRDFELIIINDASTDKTGKIINYYLGRDKRIKKIENQEKIGIAASRNKGISSTRSSYIAWQDADDVSVRERLQKQYDFLENNKNIGIVGGFLKIFNSQKTIGIRKYPPDDVTLRKIIFRCSVVAQPAAMIRKACFNKVGKFDNSIPVAEDLDMCFRIGSQYNMANIQEILINYRENPNNSTFTRLKEMEMYTIKIRKKYALGYNFRMTFWDKLYNIFQFISVFIIPPKFKIIIFNLIRNS